MLGRSAMSTPTTTVMKCMATMLLCCAALGVAGVASADNGQEDGAADPQAVVAGRDTVVQVPPGRQLDQLLAACSGQPIHLELRAVASLVDVRDNYQVAGSREMVLSAQDAAGLDVPIDALPARAGIALVAASGDCVPVDGTTYLSRHNVGYINEGNNRIATGTIELPVAPLSNPLESRPGEQLRHYIGIVTITANGEICSSVDLGEAEVAKLFIGQDGEPPACREPGARIVLYDQFGRPFYTEFTLEPGVTWALVNLAVDAFAAGQVMPVETSRPQIGTSGDSDSAPAIIPSAEPGDSPGASDSWFRPALLALGAAGAVVIGIGAMRLRKR